MTPDPLWQIAHYVVLFAALSVIVGCGCAFLLAVLGWERPRRFGRPADLGRVPLTNARRANFLDSESRRQD